MISISTILLFTCTLICGTYTEYTFKFDGVFGIFVGEWLNFEARDISCVPHATSCRSFQQQSSRRDRRSFMLIAACDVEVCSYIITTDDLYSETAFSL